MRGKQIMLRGQRMAEQIMHDRVVGVRETGTAFDEGTGMNMATTQQVYPLPGKVGRARFREREQSVRVDEQGRSVTIETFIMSLPMRGSEAVRIDDRFTVDYSPFDIALIGKTVRVKGLHFQTLSTARRFIVEVES